MDWHDEDWDAEEIPQTATAWADGHSAEAGQTRSTEKETTYISSSAPLKHGYSGMYEDSRRSDERSPLHDKRKQPAKLSDRDSAKRVQNDRDKTEKVDHKYHSNRRKTKTETHRRKKYGLSQREESSESSESFDSDSDGSTIAGHQQKHSRPVTESASRSSALLKSWNRKGVKRRRLSSTPSDDSSVSSDTSSDRAPKREKQRCSHCSNRRSKVKDSTNKHDRKASDSLKIEAGTRTKHGLGHDLEYSESQVCGVFSRSARGVQKIKQFPQKETRLK